jgi:hypothetical protein
MSLLWFYGVDNNLIESKEQPYLGRRNWYMLENMVFEMAKIVSRGMVRPKKYHQIQNLNFSRVK